MADMPSWSAPPPTFRYPASFQHALNNLFTSSQVDALLSAAKPLFVYGTLMLPAKITRVISDAEQLTINIDAMAIAENMMPALLTNYERLATIGAIFPAIVPSTRPEHIVEGLVIFGLTPTQRDYIDWYEANHYNLESVKIEISLAPDGKRTIDADTYVWAGRRGDLHEAVECPWSIEEYLTYYSSSES